MICGIPSAETSQRLEIGDEPRSVPISNLQSPQPNTWFGKALVLRTQPAVLLQLNYPPRCRNS